jgi:hypothetical protein
MTIDTLTQDIYRILDPSTSHVVSAPSLQGAGLAISEEITKAIERENRPREKGKLWASDLGKPCLRQHWYNFNAPEEGEQLNGHTIFKFLYGNILEETVLELARQAGHKVSYEQEVIEYQVNDDWTVRGRIDAVIDGTLVDVKTTSSYGYKKYTTEGLDATNDTFGYLYQLGFYTSFSDEGTHSTGVPGFVWIDKQNGHIAYTPVDVPCSESIRERAESIVDAIEGREADASRGFSPEPYGKSGNQKLGTGCSYCAFKHRCWRDANDGEGLKGYLYSHGPVWFTDITRLPKATVPRLDQEV